MELNATTKALKNCDELLDKQAKMLEETKKKIELAKTKLAKAEVEQNDINLTGDVDQYIKKTNDVNAIKQYIKNLEDYVQSESKRPLAKKEDWYKVKEDVKSEFKEYLLPKEKEMLELYKQIQSIRDEYFKIVSSIETLQRVYKDKILKVGDVSIINYSVFDRQRNNNDELVGYSYSKTQEMIKELEEQVQAKEQA